MSDSSFKLDKTVFSIGSHAEHQRAERAYWLSKTPLERLVAAELLRQISYGYNPLTDKVQRILRVIDLEGS
jgi:hypothetical protein